MMDTAFHQMRAKTHAAAIARAHPPPPPAQREAVQSGPNPEPARSQAPDRAAFLSEIAAAPGRRADAVPRAAPPHRAQTAAPVPVAPEPVDRVPDAPVAAVTPPAAPQRAGAGAPVPALSDAQADRLLSAFGSIPVMAADEGQAGPASAEETRAADRAAAQDAYLNALRTMERNMTRWQEQSRERR